MYPVTISDEPARRVVGLPHIGPFPEVGPVFQKVAEAIGAAGLWPKARGGVMVSYSDPDVTPAAELQSFAGVILSDDTPCPAGLEERTLAAGRHAVLEMTGPYSDLAAAWGWLYGDWMAAEGERPAAAPAYEIYLNDPSNTPPEALRTDLYAPLA
jgi:AraC family transcriptional regulator